MAELYSEEQIDKLSKYEKVLDKWVDMIDDAATVDVKKNSDFRKVRILLETINTSTESIHKAAANKAKADANKNNEESNKLLVAIALKELASDRNIQHDDSSRPHISSVRSAIISLLAPVLMAFSSRPSSSVPWPTSPETATTSQLL